MIIIWGSRLYGKTDEVPGLFHVATKFGHIWYLPLIPTGSYLVFDQTSEGWRGIPITLSAKSLLLGWLRAGCLIAAVILAITGFVQAKGSSGDHIIYLLLGAAAFVGFLALMFARPLRYAGYDRAVALAEAAGMPEKVKVALQLQFGMIDEARAREALAAAEAADIATQERELARRKSQLDALHSSDEDLEDEF